MSARSSFLASAVLAVLPLVAALIGLSRLLSSWGEGDAVTPIAGMCQLAYEHTIDKAGHLGITFLLSIIFAFSGRALYVLWRDWKRTANVRRAMVSLPGQASGVIDRLQSSSPRKARIDVVEADAAFGLTVGYLRPRIVLSSRLVELLDDSELEAVIRHEFVHASRLDPLRVLLSDFFRAGLPFVPALSYLLEEFRLRKEIEADAVVVESMRTPGPLAAALRKVLCAGPSGELTGAGLTPTEARVDALLGRAPRLPARSSVLLLAVVSALTLSLMSGALYVLFSGPAVVTKHVCLPAGF